jgi:peroxiredoxin Q/BCP
MDSRRHTRLAGLLVLVVLALAMAAPAAALQVGQKAPDFTLPGSDGKQVKLSELTAKGPVVLYTFIQAFTPT